MEVQRGIALEKNQARVGQRTRVLVDEVEGDLAIARAVWQAPEVDGVVEVEGAGSLTAGTFVEVEITGAGDMDLTARVTT